MLGIVVLLLYVCGMNFKNIHQPRLQQPRFGLFGRMCMLDITGS